MALKGYEAAEEGLVARVWEAGRLKETYTVFVDKGTNPEWRLRRTAESINCRPSAADSELHCGNMRRQKAGWRPDDWMFAWMDGKSKLVNKKMGSSRRAHQEKEPSWRLWDSQEFPVCQPLMYILAVRWGPEQMVARSVLRCTPAPQCTWSWRPVFDLCCIQ